MTRSETVRGLHVADDGDAGLSRAVVALHSIGADHRLWAAQVPALVAVGGRFLRPDARGHGHSRWPGSVTVEDWVADLDAVLGHAGVEDVDLLGVSMGGVQALAYATMRPERVRSLVVADSFSRLDPESAAGKIDTLVGSARRLGMEAFADRYVQDTVRDGGGQGAADLRDAIAGVDVEAYAASAHACFTADLHDRLATVEAPALVLWGEHDNKTTREQSLAIASELPDARFTTIAGAGHLPTIDVPEAVAEEIGRFLQDVRDAEHARG